MDPSGRDNLAGRILSASAPAVVLLGGAASGKTSAALGVYRRFDRDGRCACLFLAPNVRAASQIRRKLLADSPSGVVVAPQVSTFAALAARILAAAAQAGRLVSPFRRRLLIGRIVDELVASGKLKLLAAVADTPGLAAALDRAIAELKRASVAPAEMKKALRQADRKGQELLAVYSRYQEQLHASGTYDVEGQMWQARDCLSADRAAPGLNEVEAVIADGFTDFTPTQLQILVLLADRGKRILMTLPYAQDARARLWHWTARTLGNVRRAFAGKIEEIVVDKEPPATGDARADSPGAHSLDALRDRVFNFDAEACKLAEGISLIASPGIDAEVAAVAGRIKRLLLAGGAGRIAVLARSMDAYRQPVERIFAEHDIPVSPAAQELTGVPVVRFALSVASLAPELAFRDVLGVITSSYFSPGVLGDFDARSVAAAEMIIREGNVLAGREAYAKAAERLARRPTEPAEDDDEPAVALGPFTFTPQAILKAAEMLNRLFDLSEGPGRATCAAKIAAIMEGLQLYRAASSHDDPALAARDLRALAALQSALAELDEPDVSQARLRDALAAVMCPAAHTEALVDVMDVLDARSLRYDHVFLLGLSEGQFPHRFTESPLVSEADRLAWARRGMVLDCRGDLTAREMLLFYLAVSRADASLTLSYVEADASGRPSAAGSFLESFLAPAGGLGSSQVRKITEKLQAGAFLPPAGCLSSRRDALNAALGGLFEGDDGNSQCALAWVARNSPAALERACEGLWAQSRRNTRGPCDNFDGRITDRACLEILSRRFGPDAVFSATQLNAYGQCPWQFFASYVLHLAAISEPQRRLEPVARGIFCHDVLFRLMSGLSKDSGGPVRLYEIDDAHLMERLAGAVADASAVVEAGKPPYPVLWRLQREQMHADLRDYLRAAAGRSELSPETIHVELGFGLAADAKAAGPRSESLDPASRDEPIALDTGAGVVRIRGKIDRVDRISFQGRRGLFVIDYKTGLPPRQADIQAGRNLQLPLYSTAAEKILAAESLGGAFHRIGAPEGRYETCLAAVRRRGGSYGEDAEYARKLQAALLKVGQFAAEIRGGRFDLLPTGDCPAYCPFRQICQFSEFRVELKTARGQEPRK